jgi:hypothetical protein
MSKVVAVSSESQCKLSSKSPKFRMPVNRTVRTKSGFVSGGRSVALISRGGATLPEISPPRCRNSSSSWSHERLEKGLTIPSPMPGLTEPYQDP